MLIHKDEDVKSEATNNKEKESISAIISIFHSIKCSEDIIDAAKSKVWEDVSPTSCVCYCLLLLLSTCMILFQFQNSHGICDLGLSIIKRLAQKGDDLERMISSVSLPSMLYKQHEKKEGGDSLVSPLLTEVHISSCFILLQDLFFLN